MTSTIPQTEPIDDLAERGWRLETITLPDGTIDTIQVPLTSDEFLHPKEGYWLPNSTFHDQAKSDIRDILNRRYAESQTTMVFSDVIVKWDNPKLRNNCPDVCVVFGIRNQSKNRPRFIVAKEKVRPALVVEVVSPYYRKEDREIKVRQYARAKVQEYLIIDQRTDQEQPVEEILGYKLVEGIYTPIISDAQGRILFETVGLWMSLNQGQVIMEDAQTGERLLTSVELEQRVSQAEQRANQAEQQAAKLAEILRKAGINPEITDDEG